MPPAMPLRVLAPLDGSDASWRAFERGLALLAGTPGLTVTALNVYSPGFEGAREDTVEAFDADAKDEIFASPEASERIVSRAAEIGKRHGVQVEGLVREGLHYDVILEEAERHDVILMHALSSSSLRDTLRGSRTEDIARNTQASVLLVRAD